MLKRQKILFTILSIIIFTGGCNSKINQESNNVIYNSNQMQCAENEEYIFYINDRLMKNSFLIEDKKKGETDTLIKSPFKESYELKQMIYARGKSVYYIYTIRDYSERGLYYAYNKFRIVEIDTTDFTEKTVFEVSANSGEEFLGLHKENFSDIEFYNSITGFFADDEFFYFATSEGIWSVNRISGVKNKIIENKMMRSFAYDGTNIYYINDYLQIIKYNTNTKEIEEYSDIVTEYFMLINNKLIYSNLRDQHKLYSYDLISRKIEKVHDKKIVQFVCNNDYVFYIDEHSGHLCRMDINGEDNKVVSDEAVNGIYIFPNYDKVFIFNSEGVITIDYD